MNTTTPGGEAAPHQQDLVVQVRYLAAGKPYVDPKTNENETLAQLKPAVLSYFGLVEGDVDGGRKTYAFSLDGKILSDLSVTLMSLANGKHRIEFTLLEQFIQG